MANGLKSPEDIVVTGYASRTCLGDEYETQRHLLAGESGFTDVRAPGQILYGVSEDVTGAHIAGILAPDYNPLNDPGYLGEDGRVRNKHTKELNRRHRVVQIATDVGVRATRHAGLFMEVDDRPSLELDPEQIHNNRIGVFMGTGVGGALAVIDSHERVLQGKGAGAFTGLELFPERVSSVLAKEIKANGPQGTFMAACAGGNMSAIYGAMVLKQGMADIMLVGGAEAVIGPDIFAIFDGMKALDRGKDPATASRPFDKTRAGFVPSEGGAAYVLETRAHAERRGAKIRAELIGFGVTNDAHHDTAPDPSGVQQARAITEAMIGVHDYLGRDPGAWGYINAHGTATEPGDPAEMLALGMVPAINRERVTVSSAKSMFGHNIGAAAAAEAVACIMLLDLELENELVIPSVHMDDPADFTEGWQMSPGRATRVPNLRWALNNSFGFGGFNYVTAYGRPR